MMAGRMKKKKRRQRSTMPIARDREAEGVKEGDPLAATRTRIAEFHQHGLKVPGLGDTSTHNFFLI
jgi:hypothetical protein